MNALLLKALAAKILPDEEDWLTPMLNQSGENRRVGRISLYGDDMMRTLLYEAVQVMLTRVQKWSWLKVSP